MIFVVAIPRGRAVKARFLGVIVIALATGALATGAQALPGDLDPSFGDGGRVTTALAGSDVVAEDVAIQSDGKVVTAGWMRTGSAFPPTMSFLVARYDVGGTLDQTFGNGGIATATVGSGSGANALAIQADGKIVVGGSTFDWPGSFALARFNTDGSLDQTFGDGGTVITNIGQANNAIRALAIQGDGKIVAAGGNGDGGAAHNFAVVRYHPNGSLDGSFGVAGLASTSFGRGGLAQGLAIQPDGKIVEVGHASIASYPFDALALVRFNSNGTLDPTFGSGGKVTTTFDGGGAGSDVVLQPDGKLVAAGSARTSTGNGGFGLARYNVDGSLDPSFGVGGTVFTDFGPSGEAARAVALHDDGMIVAAGHWVTPTFSGDFALARYSDAGVLDASFGVGGKVTTDFNGASEAANGLAIQEDGGIVAAGVAAPPSGTAMAALARYLPSLPPDVTPPEISSPGDLNVPATGPHGATVTWTITATDVVDGAVPVGCTPSSGSAFAIGDTLVECSAVDAAGNTAHASFVVHVQGADEQLVTLSEAVAGVGPGTSLADKVRDARAALARGDVDDACFALRSMLNQIEAQAGKSIPTGVAGPLIADATRIRSFLSC